MSLSYARYEANHATGDRSAHPSDLAAQLRRVTPCNFQAPIPHIIGPHADKKRKLNLHNNINRIARIGIFVHLVSAWLWSPRTSYDRWRGFGL